MESSRRIVRRLSASNEIPVSVRLNEVTAKHFKASRDVNYKAKTNVSFDFLAFFEHTISLT